MASKLGKKSLLQFLLWSLLLSSITSARVVQRREISNNYNATTQAALTTLTTTTTTSPTEATTIKIRAPDVDDVHSSSTQNIAETTDGTVKTTTSITKTTITSSTSKHISPLTVDTSTAAAAIPSTSATTKVAETTSSPMSSKLEQNVPTTDSEMDDNFDDGGDAIEEAEERTDNAQSLIGTSTTTQVPTTTLIPDDNETGFTTEEHRFDITDYMNHKEIQTHNPDSEVIPTTTEEIDMEDRFNSLQLTTPKTPYFDNKHSEYKSDSENDNLDSTSTQTSQTTEETSSMWEITTLYDPDNINSNLTESKNNSYFSDFTDVTSEHYDIETNEVNQTRPAQKKEKKGKYLVTEVTEQPETELNTVQPTDSMWALAALKQTESFNKKSGQHRNVTSGETTVDDNTSELTATKLISDWAAIMTNSDFSSDNVQIGDDITTTTELTDTSTYDSETGDNNVVAFTVNPPLQLVTTKKSTTKIDNSALDDVELDDDATTTTLAYESNTFIVDDNISPKLNNANVELKPTNIIDADKKETTSHVDQEHNYKEEEETDTEESDTEKPETTTENNFIIKNPVKYIITTTTSTTTTSFTTASSTLPTSTTEDIYIEVIHSSVPTKIEHSSENIKVDTTVDENNTIDVGGYVKEPENDLNSNKNFKYEIESTTAPKAGVSAETVGKKMTTERSVKESNDTGVYGAIEEEISVDKGGLGVGGIIGITIGVVGVVAVILLVGFMYIMKKRQKNMTYSQRCRPVGLDAYSLDNVSVYNSVRRKTNFRLSKRSYGNSAFEDPGLKNNVLHVAALSSFVTDQNSIFEEFKDIPQITARVDEVPAGCEIKNRYANVVPLPETRVHLKRLNDDEKTEYINANYVKGPKDGTSYYIACQAPLESTIVDFWRMIWELNSKVIIMATDINEEGVEKCAEYLPASVVIDCSRTYDDYQVTLKNREVKDKYAVSTIHLENKQTKTWREITHLWYQWPETGVPTDEASVIAMLLEARNFLKIPISEQNEETTVSTTKTENDDEKNNEAIVEVEKNGTNDKTKSLQRNQGPLTVHCSPGTGRTGTIIACDIAIRALELPTRSVDIPQIVYYVRRGRASSVRTKEQYEFIYKVSNIYATKLTGTTNEN